MLLVCGPDRQVGFHPTLCGALGASIAAKLTTVNLLSKVNLARTAKAVSNHSANKLVQLAKETTHNRLLAVRQTVRQHVLTECFSKFLFKLLFGKVLTVHTLSVSKHLSLTCRREVHVKHSVECFVELDTFNTKVRHNHCAFLKDTVANFTVTLNHTAYTLKRNTRHVFGPPFFGDLHVNLGVLFCVLSSFLSGNVHPTTTLLSSLDLFLKSLLLGGQAPLHSSFFSVCFFSLFQFKNSSFCSRNLFLQSLFPSLILLSNTHRRERLKAAGQLFKELSPLGYKVFKFCTLLVQLCRRFNLTAFVTARSRRAKQIKLLGFLLSCFLLLRRLSLLDFLFSLLLSCVFFNSTSFLFRHFSHQVCTRHTFNGNRRHANTHLRLVSILVVQHLTLKLFGVAGVRVVTVVRRSHRVRPAKDVTAASHNRSVAQSHFFSNKLAKVLIQQGGFPVSRVKVKLAVSTVSRRGRTCCSLHCNVYCHVRDDSCRVISPHSVNHFRQRRHARYNQTILVGRKNNPRTFNRVALLVNLLSQRVTTQNVLRKSNRRSVTRQQQVSKSLRNLVGVYQLTNSLPRHLNPHRQWMPGLLDRNKQRTAAVAFHSSRASALSFVLPVRRNVLLFRSRQLSHLSSL